MRENCSRFSKNKILTNKTNFSNFVTYENVDHCCWTYEREQEWMGTCLFQHVVSTYNYTLIDIGMVIEHLMGGAFRSTYCRKRFRQKYNALRRNVSPGGGCYLYKEQKVTIPCNLNLCRIYCLNFNPRNLAMYSYKGPWWAHFWSISILPKICIRKVRLKSKASSSKFYMVLKPGKFFKLMHEMFFKSNENFVSVYYRTRLATCTA